MSVKLKISHTVKILTLVSAFLGVFISFFYAKEDGYYFWWSRLLYFTGQSNLWIGITFLVTLLSTFGLKNYRYKWRDRLYLIKFVFTVSITITAIVFCFFLAPFADESYHVWSFYSILNHVVTPVLAVADLFLDKYKINLKTRHVLLSITPALVYFTLVGILGAFEYDFGRGETYPYFFMNFRSPAGFFGFASEPNFLGTFYWLLLFGIIMTGVGYVYLLINEKLLENRSVNNKKR